MVFPIVTREASLDMLLNLVDRTDPVKPVELETYQKMLLSSILNDLSFWETSQSRDLTNVECSCAVEAAKESTAVVVVAAAATEAQPESGSVSRGGSAVTEGRALARRMQSEESSGSLSESSVPEPLWKSTVDPNTGRTYYYHSVTRETQWEKPSEVRAYEKNLRRAQRKRDKMFFRIMEDNIVQSLQRGELIPGIARCETSAQGPPMEPLVPVTALRVRTISAMDERMLAEVNGANGNSNSSSSKNVGSTNNSSVNAGHSVKSSAGSPFPAAIRPGNSVARPRLVRRPSTDGRPPLPKGSSSRRIIVDSPTSEDDSGREAPQEIVQESRDEVTVSSTTTSSSSSQKKSHLRRNTGGTIYMQSTMDNPDVQATIKCVCAVYRTHIVEAAKRKHQRSPNSTSSSTLLDIDVFSDNYCAYPRKIIDAEVPSLEAIEAFYDEFFKRSQLEHDTIIMSLIYVERLIKESQGQLTPTAENWRSVLCSCMILASKVWDDLSMWNIDFSNVSAASGLSLFSLQRINQLEIAVLTSLNFRVEVPASEYAKYYFLIRTMLIRSGLLTHAPTKLGSKDAQTLESRTVQYQDAKLNPRGSSGGGSRRHQSVDWSALGAPQQQSTGPVLKDSVCLEQLLSTK